MLDASKKQLVIKKKLREASYESLICPETSLKLTRNKRSLGLTGTRVYIFLREGYSAGDK